MNNQFAIGQQVRCKGREQVGIVQSFDGDYAMVSFEARAGTVTLGFYPVALLEAVAAETLRPRATLRDVLGPLTVANGKDH